MTTHPTTMTPKIDHLRFGLERRWYHERQVVAYTQKRTSKATIDLWRMAVLEDTHCWPYRKPHLVIHDLSHLSWTPHLRSTIESIAHYYPEETSGRYAVVITKSLMSKLTNRLRGVTLDELLPPFESQFFYQYDPACEWVCELVKCNS